MSVETERCGAYAASKDRAAQIARRQMRSEGRVTDGQAREGWAMRIGNCQLKMSAVLAVGLLQAGVDRRA
jgi:hypothetical protein